MATKSLNDQLKDVDKSYRKLVHEIEERLDEMEQRVSDTLDDVQDHLPDDAAEMMRRVREVNRSLRTRLATMSDQALAATKEAVEAVAETGGRLTGRSRPAAKSKASKKTAKKTAAKKPAAKKATAKKTAAKKATAKKATAKKSAAGKSRAAVDNSWTKAALYAEATRLGIGGRSSMTKPQLIKAIKQA